MKRFLRTAIFAVSGLLTLGLAGVVIGILSPLQIHHSVAHDFEQDPYGPDLEGRPFVGLALSGGGTRAALFGAAGMEALANEGLLQDVTHVSSVSGGGFPAAYLATNPLPLCAEDDDQNACLDPYFARMQEVIGAHYLNRIHLAQITTPWRLLQPSRRLTSLHEVLDRDDFLAGRTFADIEDGRGYLFNAISYDTGQRFVFSNLTLPHYAREGASILPSSLRALSFSEPGRDQPAPADFHLSMAVATSAAFPPYLGPLSIAMEQDGAEPTLYRRLGDGGVLENSGVESLVEVFLARLDPEAIDIEQPAPESGLIYAFNAGLPLDAEASQRNRDLSILSLNLPQFVDVLLTYATAQREAFLEEFTENRGIEVDVISFDYLDVAGIVAAGHELSGPVGAGADAAGQFPGRSWSDWDGWRNCDAPAPTPLARLRVIPTSLSITDCDADLITQAAEFLVDACLRETPYAGCFEGRARP